MAEEEGHSEFLKLVDQCRAVKDAIMEKAIKDGKWRPGLDSNRELFSDVNKKSRRLHAELVAHCKGDH